MGSELKNTGSVDVVSTGPGGTRELTPEALAAIQGADILVGYDKYMEEISGLIGGREVFVSGMTQEIQRINQALDHAVEGKRVALISNGDAGVYGMASLLFELAAERNLTEKLNLRVVPGVTSLLTLAARAGAPLSQDFAVISLSDRLTPIEVIGKRIEGALMADFVLGIYNPLSRTRTRPYEIFLETLGRHRPETTPVVLGKDLDRPDERVEVVTVGKLVAGDIPFAINMSTILLVGNLSTRVGPGGFVLTPRGYLDKYEPGGKKRQGE